MPLVVRPQQQLPGLNPHPTAGNVPKSGLIQAQPVGAQVGRIGMGVKPSQIAQPPKPKQTPTGGSQYKTAPNPLVNAAVKQTGAAASAGGAPKGPPPGAPDPGTPNTTPPANPNPIPLQPVDEASIAAANQNYATGQAGQNLNMQQAALAYGDPNLMPQWGLPATVNPNSALAQAALAAEQSRRDAEDARNRQGTFFSSLLGNDLSKVADTQQRAQLAGLQSYQNALAGFRTAMQGITDTRDNAIRAAQADERQQALTNLPTPDQASGGFAAGDTSNPTPRTGATKGSTATKGAKAPKVPATKVPKISGGKTSGGKVPSRRK